MLSMLVSAMMVCHGFLIRNEIRSERCGCSKSVCMKKQEQVGGAKLI